MAPDQCPYQVSTSYTLRFRDIAGQDFIGQGHYGKVKGQIMTLHNYTP